MEIWQHHKLDELGSVSRGRSRHRPRNDPSLFGGQYPFFQTGDVKAADFHLSKYSQTYNEKGLAQGKLWKPGTLCITIAANIAETAVLQIEGCFPDSVVGFVADPQKADVRFIKYSVDLMKLRMQNISRGTTQDNLSVEKLLSFDFLVPSVDRQREIADVIAAYDSLIENNTRRIEILEAMAQSLYREWFVDFRFPGHERASFVNSSFGKVPEGWLSNYPNYVDFLEGPGLRNWQYRDEGIPFLNIRTLVNNDIDASKLQHVDEEEATQRYSHFLLRAYDHVVSSSGTIGRIVTIQERHLPLMLNTSVIRMRPKKKAIDKWQLKHFLQSDYFQEQIRAQASGVAQSNYGPTHLKTMWILAPREDIGQAYENLVSPLEELICQLVNKNSNLRRTRDLLLPKLISGEVEIHNLTSEKGISKTWQR